jgi:hypothetical protein
MRLVGAIVSRSAKMREKPIRAVGAMEKPKRKLSNRRRNVHGMKNRSTCNSAFGLVSCFAFEFLFAIPCDPLMLIVGRPRQFERGIGYVLMRAHRP